MSDDPRLNATYTGFYGPDYLTRHARERAAQMATVPEPEAMQDTTITVTMPYHAARAALSAIANVTHRYNDTSSPDFLSPDAPDPVRLAEARDALDRAIRA